VALIGGGVAATVILLLVIIATVVVIILICGKTRKNQTPIREEPYYTAIREVNTARSGINVPLGADGAISAVGSCIYCARRKGSHTYDDSIDPSMMFANEAYSKGGTVVISDTVRTNADMSMAYGSLMSEDIQHETNMSSAAARVGMNMISNTAYGSLEGRDAAHLRRGSVDTGIDIGGVEIVMDSDAESSKSVTASMVEDKMNEIDKQDTNKSDCDDGGEEKAEREESDTP
jgi:hypothetical protein